MSLVPKFLKKLISAEFLCKQIHIFWKMLSSQAVKQSSSKSIWGKKKKTFL